jgi:hypothetical protein
MRYRHRWIQNWPSNWIIAFMVISVYISIESFRYLYLVTPISYYNNKNFSKTKKNESKQKRN